MTNGKAECDSWEQLYGLSAANYAAVDRSCPLRFSWQSLPWASCPPCHCPLTMQDAGGPPPPHELYGASLPPHHTHFLNHTSTRYLLSTGRMLEGTG